MDLRKERQRQYRTSSLSFHVGFVSWRLRWQKKRGSDLSIRREDSRQRNLSLRSLLTLWKRILDQMLLILQGDFQPKLENTYQNIERKSVIYTQTRSCGEGYQEQICNILIYCGAALRVLLHFRPAESRIPSSLSLKCHF